MCLSGGTVQTQGVVTQNSGYLYLNGGVLQAAVNNSNFLNNTNGLIQTGGAIINTNGNNITISSQLVPDPNLSTTDGGLTKQGAGTLTLTNGNNSYAGGTTVNGGTLKLGNPYVLGTGGLTVNNGTLELAGNSLTVASLSGSAGVISNNGAGKVVLTLGSDTTPAGTTTSFSGVIQDNAGTGGGTVAVTLNSPYLTLVLSGTDSYTGGTNVDEGTLEAANSDAISPGSGLTVGSGGTVVFADPPGAGATMVATSLHAASPASSVAAVPEPGTLALSAAGALAGAFGVWRRRKAIRA